MRARATARQMSMRSPGGELGRQPARLGRIDEPVAASCPFHVARRLGQRHRARCVGPLAVRRRAEVLDLDDLAEHCRDAQDGLHVGGQVVGRRFRRVEHDGLERVAGPRSRAEGHDDGDG
jgi:hypothetical protein